LFNKRNIPNIAIYATCIIGIAFLLAMPNYISMLESAAFAAIAFSAGFLFYKAGQIGLGDVIEIAVLSLIIPFQNAPFMVSRMQYSFPFVLSLFIASGFAALVIVPLVYIPKAAKKGLLKSGRGENRKAEFKVVTFSAAYLTFAGMLAAFGMLSLYGAIIIGIFVFGSALTILFEKAMQETMVEYKKASSLEADDMIAMNLIGKKLLDEIKAKIPEFNGLVTKSIIEEIKKKRIDARIPVYERGIPFAVPIFFGLVISLLFGNLLLLIV